MEKLADKARFELGDRLTADIIEILTYNLSNEGYNVKSAVNGIEALKKAKKFEAVIKSMVIGKR